MFLLRRTTIPPGHDSTFSTSVNRQNGDGGDSTYLYNAMPVDLLAHIFMERLPLAKPDPGLADIVEGYYHVTWEGREKDVWASLDGAPVLVFLLNAPYRITFRGGHNRVFNRAFFCSFGLQDTYITHLPKGMELLVVRFTNCGLYHLLQRPAMGIQRALCGIGEIWGKPGEDLAETICNSRGKEQLGLLEAFLLQELPAYTAVNYMLQSAVQLIRDHQGRIAVSDICSRLRLNYKWLERNFRRYLGVTPKAYLSSIRFLHAYFSLMQNDADLISIALDSGYYDQNHFIRDCRKYTGQAPSRITSLYQPALPVL
ncbi:helix-turn-helix transcriptional regulator [Chitinophaga filiformis]|uniref:helix-turn-helix domain-containing protein n=1 Tax=Chitinophaga filiformis TaxID=104663 RepID=UPI001F478671|nr:helix-turn-helix transcriptional regulator [Chitinophaga filiformis]MCF6402041.1 helix-turn-helix transcriptional regulator [Chitinophaga filiformis]